MEFNPLDLSGRRYLITGAASGIGKATSILSVSYTHLTLPTIYSV